MLWGLGKFILIALVTLPIAGGIPLAILAYIDFRRDSARHAVKSHAVVPLS